jgi:hypothetical protein
VFSIIEKAHLIGEAGDIAKRWCVLPYQRLRRLRILKNKFIA